MYSYTLRIVQILISMIPKEKWVFSFNPFCLFHVSFLIRSFISAFASRFLENAVYKKSMAFKLERVMQVIVKKSKA